MYKEDNNRRALGLVYKNSRANYKHFPLSENHSQLETDKKTHIMRCKTQTAFQMEVAIPICVIIFGLNIY